jgi:hypothetical protein
MRIPKRAAGAIAAIAGIGALTLGAAGPAHATATHSTATTTTAVSHHAGHGCGYWDDCDDWYGGGWGWGDGGWYGDWGW